MTREVVAAFDPAAHGSARCAAFREDLVALLQSEGVDVLTVSKNDFSRSREMRARGALVICEPGAVASIGQRDRQNSALWLLVVPDAHVRFPEARGWVDVLAAAADVVAPLQIITDSEEGRDQIEAALGARRPEVVVLSREDPPRGAGHADDRPISVQAGSSEDGDPSRAGWDEPWEAQFAGRPRGAAARTQWADPAAAATVLRSLLDRRVPDRLSTRVGVFGTNLGFIEPLMGELAAHRVASATLQEWTNVARPDDVQQATDLLRRSDTVVAEWIRPHAGWLQRHASPSTFLIVRGHRYEVTTDFPRGVDTERFDALTVVAPWVGRELVERFGWPSAKMVVIPNYVPYHRYARPKLPGAQFTLGMVGIRPALKRLDLALELVSRLRSVDARYNLRIRSALPHDYLNWSRDRSARAQWSEAMGRIKHDPLLRGGVFFDDPGHDMPSWYRQIGVVLSLSDVESQHLALAEGMASGALGVARRWTGVEEAWPVEIVHDTIASAADAILSVRPEGALAEAVAHYGAVPVLDEQRILDAWTSLVAGRLTEARSYFGGV